MLLAHALRSAPRVNRMWTEQWPFHRIIRARLQLLGVEAAEDLVRIPHDHLVERNAHLVGGVAAKMLVGKEEDLLAALERPLQRRRGVRRRADGAAALADERFDRRGGVDVGDRHDADATPICVSSSQHVSS